MTKTFKTGSQFNIPDTSQQQQQLQGAQPSHNTPPNNPNIIQ